MRALAVLAVGPSTLVQDAGRPGFAHLGVPRSGWLDPRSAYAANRLVGNTGTEAVLECLMGGVEVRPSQAMAVAVTGAWCEVRRDGRPVAHGEPLSLRAGERLRVGVPPRGLRCYLAVAGGVDAAPVLGSRATDTLAGLGPPPVRAGDVLPVAPAVGAPVAATVVAADPVGTTVLRVRPGPRWDWMGDPARLLGPVRVVDADSDRVALRLGGPTVARAEGRVGGRVGEELPSEGMAPGSIQLPPDGHPVVFLRDHPVTGGYPVVGVVEEGELGRCGQLRPGLRVRLVAAR